MEILVEAEDDGTVTEIRCQEASRQRRRRGSRPGVTPGPAARRRQARPRPPGRGGGAAADRQPRAPERARHEILEAIAAALAELDDGIATRCVLIAGAPHVFSAGYDIATISEEASSATPRRSSPPLPRRDGGDRRHPWPVVAAISGLCLGGGLELAITCDLRICAAGAQLGMPPAKLGLIYGHTGLRRFLDTIGLPRTKELFLTGRNLSAERAERIGLVDEVVADGEIEDASVALAAAIAANAPLSTSGNKRVIDVLVDNPALSDAKRPSSSPCAKAASPPRTSARASAPSPRSAGPSGAGDERRPAARRARPPRPGDGGADRADRPDRPGRAPRPPQRGAPRRRLRGAAALDHWPAGLDQSGADVHGRVLDLFGGRTPSPEQLLALSVEDLRGVGLSGRKVTYIRTSPSTSSTASSSSTASPSSPTSM